MPARALSFMKRGSYYDMSRSPRYSVVFALPLLLAYEALAAALSGPRASSQVRNGADVLLKEAFIAVAGRNGAGVFATLVGALIFSAFHYIGPFGDPFRLTSFTFRALSGVAFSALYLLRGFGITAWTHSLYDAFLLLG